LSLVIAIDAMGGDHAPREVVRGSIAAARLYADTRLLLVGREAEIRKELQQAGAGDLQIDVVPADEIVEMGDSPVESVRKKKKSSISVATRLVASGQAAALVSAGNTGACVAAATLLLGLLPEVRRAGIAVAFHAGDRPVVVIDVGANVASKPDHLIQYAIMASLYARTVLGVENPRVGLLNIGEENEKGNSLAKLAHGLFKDARLNFAGNIEGVEMFRGVCDVVVCDGFVGNIVLKVSEGLAERLATLFRGTVEATLGGIAAKPRVAPAVPVLVGGDTPSEGTDPHRNYPDASAAGLVREIGNELLGAFSALRQKLDYSEYGGAPLLGVKGAVVIAHGRSDARAITNAIRVARRMAELDLQKHISEEIRACTA
jgi:glycerol-3-phosphate acyltransferase PlsX